MTIDRLIEYWNNEGFRVTFERDEDYKTHRVEVARYAEFTKVLVSGIFCHIDNLSDTKAIQYCHSRFIDMLEKEVERNAT